MFRSSKPFQPSGQEPFDLTNTLENLNLKKKPGKPAYKPGLFHVLQESTLTGRKSSLSAECLWKLTKNAIIEKDWFRAARFCAMSYHITVPDIYIHPNVDPLDPTLCKEDQAKIDKCINQLIEIYSQEKTLDYVKFDILLKEIIKKIVKEIREKISSEQEREKLTRELELSLEQEVEKLALELEFPSAEAPELSSVDSYRAAMKKDFLQPLLDLAATDNRMMFLIVNEMPYEIKEFCSTCSFLSRSPVVSAYLKMDIINVSATSEGKEALDLLQSLQPLLLTTENPHLLYKQACILDKLNSEDKQVNKLLFKAAVLGSYEAGIKLLKRWFAEYDENNDSKILTLEPFFLKLNILQGNYDKDFISRLKDILSIQKITPLKKWEDFLKESYGYAGAYSDDYSDADKTWRDYSVISSSTFKRKEFNQAIHTFINKYGTWFEEDNEDANNNLDMTGHTFKEIIDKLKEDCSKVDSHDINQNYTFTHICFLLKVLCQEFDVRFWNEMEHFNDYKIDAQKIYEQYITNSYNYYGNHSAIAALNTLHNSSEDSLIDEIILEHLAAMNDEFNSNNQIDNKLKRKRENDLVLERDGQPSPKSPKI